eukprot:6204298-Pleurochrysis_carterae.AAC.3
MVSGTSLCIEIFSFVATPTKDAKVSSCTEEKKSLYCLQQMEELSDGDSTLQAQQSVAPQRVGSPLEELASATNAHLLMTSSL